MFDSLRDFMASQVSPVNSSTFVVNFILVGILCSILGFIYKRYGHSLSNRTQFAKNFILLGMATMFIITVVKSSLALSLGLVGALSIVRFRSAIKEPEELTYLFIAIAIGLGLGANQAKVTLIAFVIIVGVIYLQHFRRPGVKPANMILTVSNRDPDNLDAQKITEILQKYCSSANLRRLDETDSSKEISFVIGTLDFDDLMKVESELRSQNKGSRISFIDNTGLL